MSAPGARRRKRQKPKAFCNLEELILLEKSDFGITLFSFQRQDGAGWDYTLIPGNLWQYLVQFSPTIMPKPRILLISSQHLFGESLEMILRAEKEMELIGPWNLSDQDICERLVVVRPSVIVIADENLQNETAAELTKTIIEQHPEVSVIRTGLNENIFRIFSTHTLPARGHNLLETIRTSIAQTQESTGPDCQ